MIKNNIWILLIVVLIGSTDVLVVWIFSSIKPAVVEKNTLLIMFLKFGVYMLDWRK